MPSTPTLKQRLTALTQSPPSPSSPQATPTKRRFTAPWVKRTTAQGGRQDEFTGEDRVQFIMSRMIYQAGVDYECARSNVMTFYDN